MKTPLPKDLGQKFTLKLSIFHVAFVCGPISIYRVKMTFFDPIHPPPSEKVTFLFKDPEKSAYH